MLFVKKLNQNQIVIVDKLYEKLYLLFKRELKSLNIGYQYNKSRINEMMDIVNAIDYIKYGQLSRREIIKIIKRYE